MGQTFTIFTKIKKSTNIESKVPTLLFSSKSVDAEEALIDLLKKEMQLRSEADGK